MTDPVIILGSGDLYLGQVADVATADDATITAALVKVGEIQGGASLTYKPSFTQVRGGALNGILGSFLTQEEVTFKSGILTWDIENIEKLTAAKYTDTSLQDNMKRIGIGGIGDVPINYLRFVHTKKSDGNTLTVNVFKAQNQSGIELTFDPEKETVIDAEFTALSVTDKTDGNLVEIIEEVNPMA